VFELSFSNTISTPQQGPGETVGSAIFITKRRTGKVSSTAPAVESRCSIELHRAELNYRLSPTFRGLWHWTEQQAYLEPRTLDASAHIALPARIIYAWSVVRFL
jgi:hypothetical protein